MRTISLFIISAALAACDQSPGPPKTVTVRIPDGNVPLAMFRNESDAAWTPATRVSAADFTIVVNGPYWVSLVCLQGAGTDSDPVSSFISIRQIGRTLDDPTELDVPACSPASSQSTPPLPSTVSVTGQLAQGGRVMLADAASGADAGQPFTLRVAPGTYALYAVSSDHALIQRDLEITANTTLPPIDIDASGTALTDARFTIANPNQIAAAAIEVSTTEVSLWSAQLPPTEYFRNLNVYYGDASTTKLVPPEILTADDVQTLAFQERTVLGEHVMYRAIRKPYHAGDSTAVTLPEAINDLQWSTDRQFSPRWRSLPDLAFHFEVIAWSGDLGGRHQTLDVSRSFLTATAATELTIETDLPGMDPSWLLDRTYGFRLDAYAETSDDPANVGMVEDFVNASQLD